MKKYPCIFFQVLDNSEVGALGAEDSVIEYEVLIRAIDRFGVDDTISYLTNLDAIASRIKTLFQKKCLTIYNLDDEEIGTVQTMRIQPFRDRYDDEDGTYLHLGGIFRCVINEV